MSDEPSVPVAGEPAPAVPQEPTTPPVDPPPVEPTSDPLDIARWVEENHGLKLTEKYKSDEDFLAGAASAMKKVGERDEDAEFARTLLKQFGGDRAKVLAALTPPPAATATVAAAPKTNGVPEWDPQWVTLNEKGEPVPSALAPPDIVQKQLAYNRWLSKRLHDIATAPDRDPDTASQLKGPAPGPDRFHAGPDGRAAGRERGPDVVYRESPVPLCGRGAVPRYDGTREADQGDRGRTRTELHRAADHAVPDRVEGGDRRGVAAEGHA